MPILYWIAGAILPIVGNVVGKVLVALGIGFATYKGLDLILDQVKQQISTYWSGLPSDFINIAGLLGVDTAMTILISAYVAAITINLTVGSATKMVVKS